MLKLSKFMSLILLSNMLVIGCNRINNFDEGKAFINDIKSNFECKFKLVTSFGSDYSKYHLMSEYDYKDIEFSNYFYKDSYEYNVRNNVCSYYLYNEGLEYDYTLAYDELYYEYYNLCNTYSVIDNGADSNIYWDKVLNRIESDKGNVSELSISILNGILELIEGNIESKYNLDYELEFFNDGTFKAYIEASDKKENIYYEIEFNDYLLTTYSVTYKKGLTYNKEEYNYIYSSNLDVPCNYSKEDNTNLKGSFINEYLDSVKSNVLDNRNYSINECKSFNVSYSNTTYKNGVKKVEFDKLSLDLNGNIMIHNDDKYIYIMNKDNTYYLYDVLDLTYEEIDESEYLSYSNLIKIDYRTYQGYLENVLSGLSSNEEVIYYSNKPFDLDLKYASYDYSVNMKVDNSLLSYLFVNEYNVNEDSYIELFMNDYSSFELLDFSNYKLK